MVHEDCKRQSAARATRSALGGQRAGNTALSIVRDRVIPRSRPGALMSATTLWDLEILGRLVIAAALASFLGWERERAGKPAGLRTHAVVGTAAALFASLTDVIVDRYAGAGALLRINPVDALSAVATGIGFLGAGIIFVLHEEHRIVGLTTAASVWATAAVGFTCGMRHYVLAVGATLLLLAVLRGLRRFEKHPSRAAERG